MDNLVVMVGKLLLKKHPYCTDDLYAELELRRDLNRTGSRY